jgi:voltage-gated potassium channel
MSRRRLSWSRPLWSSVGFLVAYYAFPVDWEDSAAVVAVSLVLTLGGVGLVGRMTVKELENVRRGEETLSAQALTMLLVLLVMSFSLAFFLVDLMSPDQIVDLGSKTDALYFTLSTMATVGYGDIHAEGQLARAMVCGLIVFDVAVVAALVRAHTSRSSDV